jgi:hypothetical protein
MPATKGLDTFTLCHMLIPLKDSSYCVRDWISEEIAMFKISFLSSRLSFRINGRAFGRISIKNDINSSTGKKQQQLVFEWYESLSASQVAIFD